MISARVGMGGRKIINGRSLLLLALLAATNLRAQKPEPAAPKPEEKASAIPWSIAESGARLKIDNPTVAATEDEQGASPRRSTKEGLQVHGWWVIDVKNPDGTVVQHREFENAVTTDGQAYLIKLLGGYVVAGDYAIQLFGGGGSDSPCGSGGCYIVRSLTTNPGSIYCGGGGFYCVTTLTSSFNPSNTSSSSMVLSGYVMATQAGVVGQVETITGPCPAFSTSTPTTASPSACLTTAGPGNGAAKFTSTSMMPVSVASGQIVQVSVTITFS